MSEHRHFDLFDFRIEIDNFVVYAASLGRCPIFKVALVVELCERAVYNGGERTRPTIKVITVEHTVVTYNHDNANGHTYGWELQKNGGALALGELDRMLVFDARRIPTAARSLLVEAAREWHAEHA